MDSATVTIFVFRMMALSQVLSLLVYVGLYARHQTGLLAAICLFSFGCYLVMPIAYQMGLPILPLDLFASSIPALVWWLARRFFVDERSVPWWFFVLWAGYMLAWIPDYRHDHGLGATGDVLFGLLPQLIKLGFVLHVIMMALGGRDSDLVTERKKLRIPVAAGAAMVTSIVILVEIWAGDDMPTEIILAGSVLLFLLTLLATGFVIAKQEHLSLAIQGQHRSDAGVAQREPESFDVSMIQRAVEQERFYANHGATLADLADTLNIPAYKLRAAINQGLGYRNFNQFLNHYRIREASERLRSEDALPILTIALDVGFKSLSSFNKSFRDAHDCTPSEYRTAADGLTDVTQ